MTIGFKSDNLSLDTLKKQQPICDDEDGYDGDGGDLELAEIQLNRQRSPRAADIIKNLASLQQDSEQPVAPASFQKRSHSLKISSPKQTLERQ